jgi:hypothetical protein
MHLLTRLVAAAALLLFIPAGRAAEPFSIRECPEVLVRLEDPVDPHGEVGPKLAEIACQKLADLAPRFGVELTGQEMIQILISDDPRAFHARTGGTLATGAVFSSRQGIITQATKKVRQMWRHRELPGLLAHELTHFLVHRVAGPRCPMWLHEGLAVHFEGRAVRGEPPSDEAALAGLEALWRAMGPTPDPRLYAMSHAAVAKVLQAAGEPTLLRALPGLQRLRDPLSLRVGDRSLRGWLFDREEPGQAPGDQDEEDDEATRPPTPPPGVTRLPLEDMLERARKKNP